MAKLPPAELLEHYRQTILTNPETYKRQLEAAREELRQKGEMFILNRDLAEADEHMPAAEKQMEIDRLDTLIGSVGERIEWINGALEAHAAGVDAMMGFSRAERRRRERAARSPEAREERAETLRTANDPLVVGPDEEPPAAAEETPQDLDRTVDT